jgi:hypothetical protein
MLVVFGGYVMGYFLATARSTSGNDIVERAYRMICDIFWITRMSWTRILAHLPTISFSQTRRNRVRPNQASVEGGGPPLCVSSRAVDVVKFLQICRFFVCLRSRSGSVVCVSRLCDLEKGDRNGHHLQLNFPKVSFGKTTPKCAFCQWHCH